MQREGHWVEFQGVQFLQSDSFIEMPSEEPNTLIFLYKGTSETIVLSVEEREETLFLPIYLCAGHEEVYYSTAICGTLKGDMYITKNETVEYHLKLPCKILKITITQMQRFITDEPDVLDFLDSLSY